MSIFAVDYLYDATRTAEMDELRPAHRRYLRAAGERGVVVLAGPSPLGPDTPAAIIFVRAENAEQALRELDGDPFFTAGLITERRARDYTVVVGGFAS
ncbi:hypothetical protein H8R18_03930 [Nanchangia anserum]|uniref:YCII-related domain-containing protein n=1 Tax=Nanchangia anserum TaxID=2692125 RepID=A0A8I0G7Q7_9ACTO|nr:YciI family protein [Nanchangia anserum]MBD3688709.1 hypothetical protein [Nanchangia anserum]QOX82456.1 hypothetical protein H8R18_03930 [Nanchangia anserum]